MNTALSWIKAYVPDLTCEDQEYMDAMTLSGTKVEGYSRRNVRSAASQTFQGNGPL